MLRKYLTATTALVAGAAVAFAAHERGVPSAAFRTAHKMASAAVPIGPRANRGIVHDNTPYGTTGTLFSNFSKDRNAEFITWYGYSFLNLSSSYYYSSHSFYRSRQDGWNAFEFKTAGGKLKTMTVPAYGDYSTAEFKGAILSVTASGLPGNVIASTSSAPLNDSSLCCDVTTLKFVHGLKKLPGGNYFVGVECAKTACGGVWDMEDTDFSGDTIDWWHFSLRETYRTHNMTGTDTYSLSTPWHQSDLIPAVGAVIIK